MDIAINQVDAMPLVKYYIEKTGIVNVFQKHLDHTSKSQIPISQTLGILIANILTASDPLYHVSEWLADYTDGKAEIPIEAKKYNDDRLGRALETLYKADRQSMMTEIASKAIEVHDIDTCKIHNDTTSITFSGAYENQPDDTVQLKHGHNKDGRPDDKQIVFGLNITEDGHVPLSFNLYDGNRNDDTTHTTNWNTLREFLQKEEFIYIADCKLASFANLQHIANHGGKFITAMPAYHSECKDFIENIETGKAEIQWTDQYEPGNPRKSDKPNIFKVFEGEKSRHGYRIIWVHSDMKADGDKDFRKRHIGKAQKALGEIKVKLNKRNLRSRVGIEKAVASAIKKVKKYIDVKITENTSIKKSYSRRGKPSVNQEPTIVETVTTFGLEWEWNKDRLDGAARVDGIYPLIANVNLLPIEVLTTYKNQSYLEKRFYTKKSVLEVAPVFLKNSSRIEAILFLYFVALMIISLMERHLRNEMKKHAIQSLPILPSRMKTKSPTWRAVRTFFRNMHLQVVREGTIVKDHFIKGLTDTHRQLLRLFGVPEEYYENLQLGWWIFDNPKTEEISQKSFQGYHNN